MILKQTNICGYIGESITFADFPFHSVFTEKSFVAVFAFKSISRTAETAGEVLFFQNLALSFFCLHFNEELVLVSAEKSFVAVLTFKSISRTAETAGEVLFFLSDTFGILTANIIVYFPA